MLALALLALPLLIALPGCGAGNVSIPSIPTVPDFNGPGGAGSATFMVDGMSTTVSQSGSIKTSFAGTPLTYSGPLGCKGRYFTGHITENIEAFFRYTDKGGFFLINNGGSPVYRFGPPQKQGKALVFSNARPTDRQITVTVNCPPSD
jgi:hypothetical protein